MAKKGRSPGKQGRGRPELPPEEKTESRSIRLQRRQWAQLDQLAAPQGEIARDWIQRLLQDILSGKVVIVETGRLPPTDHENQGQADV